MSVMVLYNLSKEANATKMSVDKGSSFAYTKTDLLEMAKGKYKTHFASAKDSQDREGIVIRSICGEISFKAINNDFLLKE